MIAEFLKADQDSIVDGLPCLEIYSSTILAEKDIEGASYPWLTLPRLPKTDVLHKVNLSSELSVEGGLIKPARDEVQPLPNSTDHPHFQHFASPVDHWTFLGEKIQVLVGWEEVVRTSWKLIHGPGVTQLVRVDFYDRK